MESMPEGPALVRMPSGWLDKSPDAVCIKYVNDYYNNANYLYYLMN